MNILYVNAGNAGSHGLESFLTSPPVALMSISPTVPQHKKYLIDLKARPMPADQVRRMISKADLVAISSFTPSINNAIEIAGIAKQYQKPVVIGGYHASLVPDTALNPVFDIAVQNEGELTFPEIVGILERDGTWTPANLKDVLGISFKGADGSLVINDRRPFIKNLDELPMPDRTLIGNTKYAYFGASVDLIESSRGCVGNCHFCCVTTHCGGVWRKKTPERVVREIEECNKGVKWIGYQDSEFTINMNRCREISDLVIDHGLDHFWYSAQARADDIMRDIKTFDRMVESGFRMLFIGIESAFQASLDRIGKNIKVETIKNCVKECHDRGVTIFGAIIIGNLGETYDQVLKTIDYATKLNIDVMQFTALTPIPGTRLWDEAEEKGWIEDRDWTHFDFVHPVMRTPDLTRKQLAELVHKAYKDFYLGNGYGDYFWGRLPRFIANQNHWWFFKMLPDFMKNIGTIQQFVTDIANPLNLNEIA